MSCFCHLPYEGEILTKNKKAPRSLPLGGVFGGRLQCNSYETVAVNGDRFCHCFGLGCLQKGGKIMRTHERRERIVQMIAMCGTVTSKELATRLRVTPRTILRDIDALSMLYPISYALFL